MISSNHIPRKPEQPLPPGWTHERLCELAEHYENQSEDEQAAEIEAALTGQPTAPISSVCHEVSDAILGCIVGGAIGDAAGAAIEGTPAGQDTRPLASMDWLLTDDTQLTLATCEALTEDPAVDPARIAAKMLSWFRARRLTGLGASTLKALRDLEAGAHWALAGRKGERGAGNGAAMRIAPVAFCLDPLADDAIRRIRDVCRITHHNDEAYVGGLAIVLAITAARSGELSLTWVASRLPDTSVRDRLLAYAALAEDESLAVAAGRFGASGYVAESVPLAVFAARQAARLGFSEMLHQVVAAGGDTDTNASLAGQIAGSALGFRGLPPELLTKLPQRDLVFRISQAFAKSVSMRSRHNVVAGNGDAESPGW